MRHRATQLETILLGESKAIRTLRIQVRAAAEGSLPVLLHGPAGSGKELTAWAIHTVSHRSGPFVPFSMSRPSDLLLHDMGSDTAEARMVLPADVRDFSGGTAFLDEIAHLQASSQTLLLQALKGPLFHRKSGAGNAHTALRLIASTSIPPKALVRAGHFQERLLRRLGGMTIAVPSLAERRKDIPLLALYFLSLLPLSQRPLGFTAAAIRRLQTFDWPGNVRELRRVVTAAAKLAPGEMLDELTIEFARKTIDSGAIRSPLPTPPIADGPTVSSMDVANELDELFSRSYRTARQTVSRWLHSPKPTARYPRLTPPPPRTRVP